MTSNPGHKNEVQGLRILVVGALSGATVDIGYSLAQAFIGLGKTCTFLDFSEYQKELLALRADGDAAKINGFLIKLQIRLIEEVQSFGPSLIVGVAQSPLNNLEVLESFKKSGIKLHYWYLEDCDVFGYWRAIAPKFDYFFTIQKSRIFEELKKLGSNNGYYLPAAFDDSFIVIESELQVAKHRAQLSFVGAPYNNRVAIFNNIKIPGFEIYGEGWHGLNEAVRVGNRRITPSERRYIYMNSNINLNLHSSSSSAKEWRGDFVNPRTYEIAGLGGFQLTDGRELMSLHFDLNKEMRVFENTHGMLEAIKYYLNNDLERRELADNARGRVLKEHTYRHRAMEILSLAE